MLLMLIIFDMSVYSNQGPLISRPHSNSEHSLYSQNSDCSLSPKVPVKLAQQKHKNQQQKTVKEISILKSQSKADVIPTIVTTSKQKSKSKLPEIRVVAPSKSGKIQNQKAQGNSFSNDSNQRYALFNQKLSSVQIREDKALRGNLFSMNQARKERSLQRYGQFDITETQKDEKRNVGTSQGSRWIKSQSHAAPPREQNNFKYLIRNFHKHNSIMIEALNKFWQLFQSIEKYYTASVYKISLYDSLEAIKLKMESFLERKINLQNFESQKPSAQWSQQKYMKFYGNYRKMLLIDHDDQQYHIPFTLKKYKNCVFFGRMSDGKKQQGILHYFNGKCYQGKFKQDQKYHGLEIDQKQLYLGYFKKGVRHGQGILKTSEALFVGTFTYGQFTTVSVQKEQSGTTSTLFAFRQETPANSNSQNKKGIQITHSAIKIYEKGLCLIKNNNGDIFIGTLGEDAQKQDEGLQMFANGDIYVGKYESGSPQGYGQYYWQNGSNYRGQFLSGMRHGRGVWQMINGDSYEGEYMNDKKNGKGIYIWKNGSKYEGNFQNDYRHGYGQMKWQDGRTFKGQWLNGIQKNTLITLQKPQAKTINTKYGHNHRPSFRTIQNDKKKKIPLDKLKSLYNPSYQ